jgi:hypothetical protein
MLEFNREKVVGKVLIEKTLTENDIANIIITGFEGGIGYWSVIDNTGADWEAKPKGEPTSTWATQLLLDGKSVKLYDVEDEDEVWTLTFQNLLEGYRLNYINRPHDNDIENGDATTADCIIQYALFGKIVFG